MNAHASENPFAAAFRTSSLLLIILLLLFLCVFVKPTAVVVPLAAALSLWAIFRRPLVILGCLLAFMPIDYLTIELGKFAGLPHMSLASACTKEVPLLLLILALSLRNGFKPAAPDWFLGAFCILATMYTLIEGSWAALAIDLNFAIPYFVGRMTLLTEKQEQKWAMRGVWIVAVLAVLGLSEVFILGDGPRTVLYVATDAATENGALTASFHAIGFEGLREAAGMIGPNSFGVLCMIALILWWAHSRNLLPAAMIGVGLVCSLTRSAWMGTAVAIPLLAFIMNQKRRFFLYAALGLALFAVSIPILGLSDYLFFNKTSQDPSAEWHRDAILNGATYAIEHPFGSGNTKFSRLALSKNNNVTIFETTYASLAASYGIPALSCFFGFLLAAMRFSWRAKSNLSYSVVGILIAMAVVMLLAIPLDDRRLACWVFFPVGLAIRDIQRSSTNGSARKAVAKPPRSRTS
jgi:O-Antigen ligase/Glycosyltransferase family 87